MVKHGGVTPIGADEFEEKVLHAKEPVLVDFFATWCGPCRALAPVLDELSIDLAGRARVVKLDVDHAPELAREHRISSIPCLVIFRDGHEVGRIVGAVPKRRIAGALDSALAA
jgi:thioredoxin 1